MCGLYVSVPAEFAGGRGACPRCKVILQIPTPIPPDSPHYVEGLRYIAEPAARPTPPGKASAIVTEDLGPSIKYDCEKCKGTFESLKAPEWPQGKCPACQTVYDNTVGHIVSFPRQLASAGQAPPSASEIQAASAPGQVLWDMQGEFLVAKPDENQSPSDSVIEPLPFIPIPLEEAATPEPEPVPVQPDPVKPQPVPVSPKSEQHPEPVPTRPQPVPVQPHAEKHPEPKPVTPESEPEKPDKESDGASNNIAQPPTPDVSKHADIENKWFYLLHGEEVGPITTDELKELVRSGKASSTVFVWQEGMESWMPIEELEELNVEPPHEAEGSFTHSSLSIVQRAGRLTNNSDSLVWMAITAACTVALLFAMRESFMDFGLIVLQLTAGFLGLAMLTGLLYGIWNALRDLKLFVRGSTTMQMKWLSGIGGLFTCILLTIMIGWQSGRGPVVPTEEYSIKKAKEISDMMVFGNLSASFNLIDWEHLIVDGDNFGEKFRNSSSMDEKLYMMEDVYEVFLNAFDPPYDRQHMRASALEDWHIKVQTIDKTVVSAFSPSSGAEIRFTLQGDRLFGLSIIPPKEDYLIEKAKATKLREQELQEHEDQNDLEYEESEE